MGVGIGMGVGVGLGMDVRPAGAPPQEEETVVRTPLGTAAGEADSTLTKTGVAVDSGCWLFVGVGYDGVQEGTAIESVTLDGVALNAVEEAVGFDVSAMQVWGGYFATATSGNLVVGIQSSPANVALFAIQVSGLVSTSPLDQCSVGTGIDTIAQSLETAVPAQSHEYVMGLVLSEGPPSDDAGAWDAPMVDGQRVGYGPYVTLSEGYHVITAAAAQEARKTDLAYGLHIATCMTFKAAS
jgi:hypothetical protein